MVCFAVRPLRSSAFMYALLYMSVYCIVFLFIMFSFSLKPSTRIAEVQHRFVRWLKMFLVQGEFRGHPLLRLLKKFSYSSRRTRFTLCPKWRTGNRLARAHLRTWERLTFVSSAISWNVINILLLLWWGIGFPWGWLNWDGKISS